MPAAEKYKIFLSYSRHDELLIKPLAALLGSASDDSVFLDVNSIKPGALWKAEIENAVRDAEVFIVCWCCESEKSEFVSYEIKRALETAGKRLVPVLLCSTPLPASLADRQWIDLRDRFSHSCSVVHSHSSSMHPMTAPTFSPQPLAPNSKTSPPNLNKPSGKWMVALAAAVVLLGLGASYFEFATHHRAGLQPQAEILPAPAVLPAPPGVHRERKPPARNNGTQGGQSAVSRPASVVASPTTATLVIWFIAALTLLAISILAVRHFRVKSWRSPSSNRPPRAGNDWHPDMARPSPPAPKAQKSGKTASESRKTVDDLAAIAESYFKRLGI